MNKIKQILIPSLTLFLICAVVAAALAVTNHITADTIEKAEAEALGQSLQTAVEDAESFEMLEFEGETYYKAVNNGETKALVFETSAKGYGGDITVLTAIDPDGTVKKVIVSDASDETTGIGTKVADDDAFAKQFEGASSALTAGEDIDAVTGATYS
ncbi:MAG: FMN-binding protein, partial [Acutalibacteraceae bacterium]